jgi:hypothetical protein
MILHGVTSGFGLSRMISSRLRRKYEHEYRKVHRSPRIIFVFDVTLGIAIIALFILVVSLIARPPEPPTLSMSFAAPSFVAGKATPMSVRLWPTDNREHSNVSVTWHIPRGWEILESDPPIRHNGMVILGTIPEGQDAVSRLIVRMFDSVGQNSVIGFTVRNLEDGTEKQYTGIGERRIVSSAITAEVPRVFDVDGVTPSGGVIPIEVRNTTDRTIPFVELRPTETSSIQFTRVTFGDLKPQESRFVYVPLGSLEESPNLEWALFATSREILRGSWSATLTSWDDPVITRPLIANPQADTFVRAEGGQGISLIMVQPFLEDAIREVQVEDEIADIKIPASNIDVTPQQQWFVAPVLRSASGDRLLGPATFGVFTGAFPFSAKAIYRTEAGDQLGLGPHPPRRGEETRYWIFWNMGPIQGKLRNVRVQTTIPKGVRLTGSIASPDGGSSTVSGQTIRWSMPEIGSDVGISEAFFGFEVSIIPGEEYEGESIQLGGITYASAVDDVSKMVLKAEKMALFSENIGVEDTAEVGGTE